LQEALLAALLGTTRRALTGRQQRVLEMIREAFNARKHGQVVKMAEEGQAVAGEVRRARPDVAARIHRMLGNSFVKRFEHVKGLGLLEQARALAVESGDREVLGDVCNSLGGFHLRQGEHEKAIEEHEQARAIAVELGDRESEGIDCHNMGLSYRSLKQYDKAIELLEQSLAVSKELGNKRVQAATRLALGRCLSRHGQHDRAVACLKHAWAVFQELGDEENQVRAANALGEALWARARAEHHQAAPDATSSGGVSAAAADTLQDAETWLRTALDLAVKIGTSNVRMSAQMHLAYVAMLQGDEDEAVELLSQHLRGWVDDVGPRRCAGCWQVRGQDAPMLRCDGCHVARCENAATPVPCGAETAMLAVRWLTGRREWMMQVLQCGAPADGVEGRG
jgi:tetratricopeptide (TPR) repeat protein